MHKIILLKSQQWYNLNFITFIYISLTQVHIGKYNYRLTLYYNIPEILNESLNEYCRKATHIVQNNNKTT